MSKLRPVSGALEKVKTLIETPEFGILTCICRDTIATVEKLNLTLVYSIAVVNYALNKLGNAEEEDGGKLKKN